MFNTKDSYQNQLNLKITVDIVIDGFQKVKFRKFINTPLILFQLNFLNFESTKQIC